MISAFLFLGCSGGGGTTNVQVESSGLPGTTTFPPGSNGGTNTGGGVTTGPHKPVLSQWNNGFYSFDFRGLSFGIPGAAPLSYNGQTCTCTVTLTGNDNTGTIAAGPCSGTALCPGYNFNGNYFFNSSAELMMCNGSGQCTAYK